MKIHVLTFISLCIFQSLPRSYANYVYESSCEYNLTISHLYKSDIILEVFKCPSLFNYNKKMIKIIENGIIYPLSINNNEIGYFILNKNNMFATSLNNKVLNVYLNYQ
ncbi:hypothetical protein PH4a_15985 [Proteus hauseri]|nr:hypothetical protein PH4a_15985 [Proteus hauseri]